MDAALELTVLHAASPNHGYVAGFAVTDQMLVAVGGLSSRAPTVIASSNARHFEHRSTPRQLGLRDVLAVGDALWACGEYGQLGVSRDLGASWELIETGTDGCLFALALGADGAIWVVGDNGYAARVLGDKPIRVDLGTKVRLASVYAVRDDIIVLGFDGKLRRWSDGTVTEVGTGSTKALTSLVITRAGTWVITGDGGFVARSPDGAWFSRVKLAVDVDLEAIAALHDGRLVIVGDRGQIFVSSDDGRLWQSVPNPLGLTHLWSVERFGAGVLIGGDDGLIVKLAPPGDATWSDRLNVFGGAKAFDDVFALGPNGFIEGRLAAYLGVIDGAAAEDGDKREVDADEDDDADNDDDDDDDDDDDSDDDDDDDDDDESEADDEDGGAIRVEDADEDNADDDGEDLDEEAFSVLRVPGDADDFRDIYGVPLPTEAATFFEAVAGHDPWSTFDEFRLDNDLRPDVGDKNLFELMVRRNQQAYLGTDLVEAFCGVFGIGSQGNGDTYHMEIYEWDGPRQVLHFDHETASFSGVFADSLDSLVYLAAIVKAGDERKISQDAYDIGIRKLRGKVAPTWHFSIEEKDPAFVMFEPKRRDSEFFFYRARWICALLKNDGVTDIQDVPKLFMPDFNQVIPHEQLPARYEACEKFIPTALYAMWRAYLFDEPELDRYLEIGVHHPARLVRDAAKLIRELRGGRNELGTIKDVRAWLAAFRALDLDPRRADQRKLEAEARDKASAARARQVAAELAQTPRSKWGELAWRWLDDGVAHRELLKQLDQTPIAAQIAALDALNELADDEREAAIPQLAVGMGPELEAILIGSLVRDDSLTGVLERPPPGGGGGRSRVDEAGDNGGDLRAKSGGAVGDEDDDDLRARSGVAVGDDDDDEDATVTRLAGAANDDDSPGAKSRVPGGDDAGDDDDDDFSDDDDDDDDDDRDDDPEAVSPGWAAIDEALAPIYADTEPLHFGTALPYSLGGNDPIHGISVYARVDPVPHWHFITYGFTDLFHKETDDPDESGFGFELTLRLARSLSEEQPPHWALNFLQNLGRYVFGTGNRFAAGHKMGLNGPIALDRTTKITAICFADDPELREINSELGAARFVQIVGITDDEYKLIQEWSTPGLVDILSTHLPHLVTDLSRSSVLDDPATARLVEQRVAAEGSSEDLTFAGEMKLDVDDGRVRIELGALYAAVLPRAMRGRIRHGRPYELRGRVSTLHLRPASSIGYKLHEQGELTLEITQELAREMEEQLRESLIGTYNFETWPALEIEVTPSFIRSQDGWATDVRGIADPERAREMIDEENERRRAENPDNEDDDLDDEDDDEDERETAGAESYDENEDEGEDDDDDDDDEGEDDDDDDDAAPDPARVMSALAMTERALRLAPDDTDVQFTHAMLLIDGEHAKLEGKGDELLTWLPRFSAEVRINVAVRLGQRGHDRFGEAVDIALADGLPERILTTSSTPAGDATMLSYGDVSHELFGELGDVILEHEPSKMSRLVPLLPDDPTLLSELAFKATQSDERDNACSLYDRLLALPIPEDGDDRANYLRAMNNACVQAHAARAYDSAVRIADRAQPVAHENPFIYHSAACAYAAVGDYGRALAQVKLAMEHNYAHVEKVEVDSDLGPLLEWPEFKALFRDWHARQEGN